MHCASLTPKMNIYASASATSIITRKHTVSLLPHFIQQHKHTCFKYFHNVAINFLLGYYLDKMSKWRTRIHSIVKTEKKMVYFFSAVMSVMIITVTIIYICIINAFSVNTFLLQLQQLTKKTICKLLHILFMSFMFRLHFSF